jgi:hypothetical protein
VRQNYACIKKRNVHSDFPCRLGGLSLLQGDIEVRRRVDDWPIKLVSRGPSHDFSNIRATHRAEAEDCDEEAIEILAQMKWFGPIDSPTCISSHGLIAFPRG